jgi:hypothetical protein
MYPNVCPAGVYMYLWLESQYAIAAPPVEYRYLSAESI